MRKKSFPTCRWSVGQAVVLTASGASKTNTVGWENSAYSCKTRLGHPWAAWCCLRTPKIPIKSWQHPGGHFWRSPPLPPTLSGEIWVHPLIHGHPPADQLRNHSLFSRSFVNNVIFALCSLPLVWKIPFVHYVRCLKIPHLWLIKTEPEYGAGFEKCKGALLLITYIDFILIFVSRRELKWVYPKAIFKCFEMDQLLWGLKPLRDLVSSPAKCRWDKHKH